MARWSFGGGVVVDAASHECGGIATLSSEAADEADTVAQKDSTSQWRTWAHAWTKEAVKWVKEVVRDAEVFDR